MQLRNPIVSGRTARAIATLAGAVFPLSFAPFGWYFLAPALLAVFFRLCETAPREAAWRGFAFGIGAFGIGTYWLYYSVRVIGGTPLPVALLLMAALVVIMAAYLAGCGYLIGRLAPVPRWLRWIGAAPSVWVLTEWLRGWVFTGFPWLTVGYGQIDGPLRAWAPLLGVYGVSMLVAMFAGVFLTLLLGSRLDRGVAALVAVPLIALTWSLQQRAWTEPVARELRVALVQGAIPQTMKWQADEQLRTMVLYQLLTSELRDEDLIIWPEAAIPAPDDQVKEYLEEISELARARRQQLLVGILTHDAASDQYGNSLLALGEPAGAYHKRHLVPFGEFFPVPGFVRAWMRLMSLPYEDITPGSALQEPLRVGDVGLAPTICYEDVFGAEQLGFLPHAQLLVNVSNDAWFGDSIAPHQHLQMARMRALETGRYMLRSTNTGITAIIDAQGDVRSSAPQFKPFVLLGGAQPFTGATPYVRTGDYPTLALAALIWAAALWTAGKRARSRD